MSALNRVLDILSENRKVPFVRRILSPSDAPTPIPDPEDPDGQRVMTHRMSWGEQDGTYLAFPQVMEDSKGNLVDYGDAAFDEANRRGDVIRFKRPEDADWFTRNYKLYWDKIGYRP